MNADISNRGTIWYPPQGDSNQPGIRGAQVNAAIDPISLSLLSELWTMGRISVAEPRYRTALLDCGRVWPLCLPLLELRVMLLSRSADTRDRVRCPGRGRFGS